MKIIAGDIFPTTIKIRGVDVYLILWKILRIVVTHRMCLQMETQSFF